MRVQQAQVQKKKEDKQMKKLMIAAAVAAMAGGAFAVPDYVYDFSATLKTTKAKAGKQVTRNLGKNAAGIIYYKDPALGTWLDNNKAPSEMIRTTVPAATNFFYYKEVKGSKIPAPTANGLADANLKNILLNLAATYNQKSDGVYCFTFTDSVCYRVAGSAKLTDELHQANCCAAGYALNGVNTTSLIRYSTYANGSASTANGATVGSPLAQMFGSYEFKNANKVEMYAQVRLFNTVGGAVFGGMLAGHGTRAINKKTNPNEYYVSTLSGNIVGTLPAPGCPNCCSDDTDSWAFDCANAGGTSLPFTAGFGTFRLKINTKKTTWQ